MCGPDPDYKSQMSEKDYIKAHKYAYSNRAELLASDICACFYCLKAFKPEAIIEWTKGDDSAICPYCHIDSVIGSACGIPLTKRLLKNMQTHWFAASETWEKKDGEWVVVEKFDPLVIRQEHDESLDELVKEVQDLDMGY
jgi:hypothetical protein